MNFPNDAGFRLDMSVNQHFLALNRSVARERAPPTPETYEEVVFSRQFDESMTLHSGGCNEDNWDLMERVLAPLYFNDRNWVPEVSNKLVALNQEFCGTKGILSVASELHSSRRYFYLTPDFDYKI